MNIDLTAWVISDLWPYAVLIGVIVCWALYRFLAPESWFEWTGAGMLQGFIIALYAEMYGFPLTIYFLAGLLPEQVPLRQDSGHLWATLLGAGQTGIIIETLIGYTMFLTGALLIMKGWVRIYFSGSRLVTGNVYSLVRHPQYLGIFMLVMGEIVDWPTIPSLIFAPVIYVIYVRLAHQEEQKMMKRFGSAYLTYRQSVPMFFPRLSYLGTYIFKT